MKNNMVGYGLLGLALAVISVLILPILHLTHFAGGFLNFLLTAAYLGAAAKGVDCVHRYVLKGALPEVAVAFVGWFIALLVASHLAFLGLTVTGLIAYVLTSLVMGMLDRAGTQMLNLAPAGNSQPPAQH